MKCDGVKCVGIVFVELVFQGPLLFVDKHAQTYLSNGLKIYWLSNDSNFDHVYPELVYLATSHFDVIGFIVAQESLDIIDKEDYLD